MEVSKSADLFPEPPEELIERLRRKLPTLQMLPAVATQALEIARQPDCSIAAFSGVVERDLKLAADILKMANSVLYSTGTPVASLHQAVVRLGFHHCRSVIVSSSYDSLTRTLGAEEQASRELLTRHGFLTAIFALRLNHCLHLGFQGEEFTAGLMHDIGRLLLSVAAPETFREADPLDFQETGELEDREREAFGVSHAEFGAWFADQSDLPQPLVAAIRFHHAPKDAGTHRRLAALTAAADELANFVQRPGRSEDEEYDPATNDAVRLLERIGAAGAEDKFAANAAQLIRECPGMAESLMQG
ncbi:MAG: HDOD domain-containing protein [Planctomyces sp.]|nr:HDOD domain-containing protein [Planctomyces sp.]